jgi:hypothetical protein
MLSGGRRRRNRGNRPTLTTALWLIAFLLALGLAIAALFL